MGVFEFIVRMVASGPSGRDHSLKGPVVNGERRHVVFNVERHLGSHRNSWQQGTPKNERRKAGMNGSHGMKQNLERCRGPSYRSRQNGVSERRSGFTPYTLCDSHRAEHRRS